MLIWVEECWLFVFQVCPWCVRRIDWAWMLSGMKLSTVHLSDHIGMTIPWAIRAVDSFDRLYTHSCMLLAMWYAIITAFNIYGRWCEIDAKMSHFNHLTHLERGIIDVSHSVLECVSTSSMEISWVQFWRLRLSLVVLLDFKLFFFFKLFWEFHTHVLYLYHFFPSLSCCQLFQYLPFSFSASWPFSVYMNPTECT